MEEKHQRGSAPPVPELPATVSVYFLNIVTTAYFVLYYWDIYAFILNIHLKMLVSVLNNS